MSASADERIGVGIVTSPGADVERFTPLRLGAALAYYTLFAIAPGLLVATGIAGLVFSTDAVRGEIVTQLDHLVGREGAHAVQSLLEGAGQRRAGILATTIGSVAFIVAATGALLELQAALNTISRVKSKPGAHLKAFMIDRRRSFAWWSRSAFC